VLYCLDNVNLKIISNNENNGDENGASYVANKLNSVNHTNDDMPEEPGVKSNIINNVLGKYL
jgi:hypothetical protein